MKIRILTLLLINIYVYSEAQITFHKTFGGISLDQCYSVQQTSDGGFMLVGTTSSFGAGSADIYLVKTDVNGDTLWTKAIGGSGLDQGFFVKQTTDGGYIITGYTESYGAGNDDAYLLKTDANGNFIWSKTFGGSDHDRGHAVQQTVDGGYIICGYTESFGAGNADACLIKTDANGNSIWMKTYGNMVYDYGNSVEQTSDSGYIFVRNTNTFVAGDVDIYLIKTDAVGDTVWTKSFGGTGNDDCYSVRQTSDGGYILVGSTTSFGSGSKDVYLIKTDSIGSLLWSKTYGGQISDVGMLVQQTSDGGYIIAAFASSFGVTDMAAYLIKTDVNGNPVWTKVYDGSDDDQAISVQQTTDNGYIIAGLTRSSGSGLSDMYLIKTDSTGSSLCNTTNPATNTTSPISLQSNTVVIVSSVPLAVSSPVMSSGSGSFNNTICTSVGMTEINIADSLSVFPNPSTGNFNIVWNSVIENAEIKIYDPLGEVVFYGNMLNQAKKEIKLQNISNGIYFIKVVDGKKSYCRKLIVEHD